MILRLVGVRSHNRNIGICRHRNAHMYILNIRFRRQVIARQHVIVNFILHRLKYFNRVAMESDFLPTLMYSSKILASNL